MNEGQTSGDLNEDTRAPGKERDVGKNDKRRGEFVNKERIQTTQNMSNLNY